MEQYIRILSGIQTQFYLSTTLYGHSAAYNIVDSLHIRGIIDENRLRDAWFRIFSSIEVFQSSFMEDRDQPEFQTFPPPWRDEICSDEDIIHRLRTESERSYDLGHAPLVRCCLYHMNDGHRILQITQHHIVTDLFSREILFRFLSHAYKDPSYTPQPVPYSRFIEAEHAFLTSPAGVSRKAFWEGMIASSPDILRLPAKNLTPKPFAGTGQRLAWRATEMQVPALKQLGEQGKAAFILLLSAYAGLLGRLSAQNRFYIGIPFTNRYAFGEEPLYGPCVNILPLLVELDPEETLTGLYGKIRRRMLEIHRNQGISLIEIARMYDAPHDPLRPRLLQAGFTNEPLLSLELEGAVCKPIQTDKSGAQMDLFFTWWEDDDGWAGYWEYNDATFSPDDVLLWQTAFSNILDAAINEPDRTLASIRLIELQRELALAGADRTVSYPIEGGMVALLRDAYRKHLSETAIVYRNYSESYGAFADKVAKVASRLSSLGGTGQRVIVLHERSPELLYALHGIVNSGNVYVPLGIDWPQARIDDILEDIRPSAVLTQETYQARFVNAGCPILITSNIVSGTPAGFPEAHIVPTDSMYILYTSGTTGRPKGAELPHGGIANRLLWMQDEYRLKPGDRCLLKTPYTFDVSGWEIFWPFLAGATLVVAEENAHKDPRELRNLILAERVRIVHFVPSMLSYFLEQEGLGETASLTDIICSGEALTTELVARFFKRLPEARLHNLYGPTEASIDVSSWKCSMADVERGTVPIGRPIANTQIWVLDERGYPCPPLVRGELYLGGICLAKGYWNRPELTVERFVPNPFGAGSLYKTGDWGRYGLDGAIEYLERRDNQVKIRGIRIELSEIEADLRQMDSIENAIVRKGKNQDGADCLIAYYVSRDGKDLTTHKITERLRETLPESVIPDYFVRLDTFPRSENGKMDRKALPEIAKGCADTRHTPDNPPKKQLEGIDAIVGEIWNEILGGDFGPEVNFFDAGGNSLNLLTLRGKLEKSFATRINLMDLFRNPTIPSMARLFSPPNKDHSTEGVDEVKSNSGAMRREKFANMSNIYRKKHKE